MSPDEYEQNRRRFGDDVTAWPAPYRQEAAVFLADRAAAEGDEQRLDRLLLEAAAMETDEHALARKVFARIDDDRAPAWSWSRLSPVAMAAAVAAVLAAATAAGYTLGGNNGASESDLLAFAIGAPDLTGDDLPDIEQEDAL